MKIFNTVNLRPSDRLSPDHKSWIYNGLDCCVTLEVRDVLREQLEAEPENVKETYATAMAKLAPVNAMCMRGLRVDIEALHAALAEYRAELRKLETAFNAICEATLGHTINWRSHVQVKSLFYETFRLKPIRKRNTAGFFAPTANTEALERLCTHFYPQVYARYILAMRALGKRIGFLETGFDDDMRMRSNLNIAGTNTGRFSSSSSAFGSGSNLQNVENTLRRVFIADPEMILVNVDLEQADARNVAARIWQIFYESEGPERAGAYLDACESGDLHTRVCAMAWQELDWPEPWDAKAAREIAEQPAYRGMSYRDLAKRLGHGTNYFGQPRTMALHTKTEVRLIEDFQERYFAAFPLIQRWHEWVQEQLLTTSQLCNLFGRRRIFFDRPNDPRTLRAAIAYDPQSSTGEELDRGVLQLWRSVPEAEPLLPVHDSILFQLPFERLEELMPRALAALRVELTLAGGRKFSVPLEAKIGWNWADSKFNKKLGVWENPYGLRKWTGKEERTPPRVKTKLKHFLS